MKREDRQETQPESPSFVNQHRVLSPMEGLCLTANFCKAGLIVGACDGLCTTARFHTVAFQNLPSSAIDCAYWLLVSSTLSSLLTSCKEPRPLFRELVYGRIKMRTALCLAWARTYQTMCLEFHLEQLRPEAFELAKPKKFTVLPPCRITTRLAGVESPGWKLVTDGRFRRNIDGNDMTGWVFAIVSPENFVESCCVRSPQTGIPWCHVVQKQHSRDLWFR